LRTLTAGESHGHSLVAIVDDVPAGVPVRAEQIDRELARRQGGYGRGGRMEIETDSVQILSGVRGGLTMGSPVAFLIENRDHQNWTEVMSVEDPACRSEKETRPRPGHADLAGMLKYGTPDARDILERASARETAARVAVGALARRLLDEIGITVMGRVLRIGSVAAPVTKPSIEAFKAADADPLRCSEPEASRLMVAEVDRAVSDGDSLGGLLEVVAFGMVPGLGSHAQHDRRLDARLCCALASIPAIKAVETGDGFELAAARGSAAHDEIFHDDGRGLFRKTNRAGGIEGGISNGEPVVLRAAMKPIPTLGRPLATVDMADMRAAEAFKERADVCAVPAATVVAEAVVALELASAAEDKFGRDSLAEIRRNMDGYLEQISAFWKRRD
jgi:chorismate synthase